MTITIVKKMTNVNVTWTKDHLFKPDMPLPPGDIPRVILIKTTQHVVWFGYCNGAPFDSCRAVYTRAISRSGILYSITAPERMYQCWISTILPDYGILFLPTLDRNFSKYTIASPTKRQRKFAIKKWRET